MIFAIIALVKCQMTVVQSLLVGSILSNLLLVLGMCFFAGGTRFSEKGFGISATRLNMSMLTLSVTAVLLPAAFHSVIQPTSDGVDPLAVAQEGHNILAISHGVAIILFFIYSCYIVFQLFSHRSLYYDDPYAPKSVRYTGDLARKLHVTRDVEAPMEGEEEKPQMRAKMAIALLVVVTVIVAITANFLVNSIDGIASSGHISKKFVGLILLPTVANASDYAIIVMLSVKKIELTDSLGIAMGSSIQIALFVFPFLTTLGWILGKPLTLLFDPFDCVVLFLSVLAVKYVVEGGKSNWLDGMILICLYVIVGVTYWFYPGSDPAGVLASCR